MATVFPKKPKGMWQRTYARLCEQAFEAEMVADQFFEIGAQRLLARIDNRKRKWRLWR
jgi:hypothetical protein